jgi:iron complex outermembrane recepter protein
MKQLNVLFFILFSAICEAQIAESSKILDLQQVVVSAYKDKPIRETALNIATLQVDSLSRLGNFNLTDMIAKVPGVSMLSTA